MVEVMIMATSSKRSHDALRHWVPPALQQATADPCLRRRLLDNFGQVWVSLLRSHCSFLMGPGAHKVLFVPAKGLFLSPCIVCGVAKSWTWLSLHFHSCIIGCGRLGYVRANIYLFLLHFCRRVILLHLLSLALAMWLALANGVSVDMM